MSKSGSKYTYTELATGSSDNFKKYNIYDMAGNVWEWTTGHNINGTQMFVIPRGGGFLDDGTANPVVRVYGTDEFTSYYFYIGFRVVLYIQ